jgi:hypothetical protein
MRPRARRALTRALRRRSSRTSSRGACASWTSTARRARRRGGAPGPGLRAQHMAKPYSLLPRRAESRAARWPAAGRMRASRGPAALRPQLYSVLVPHVSCLVSHALAQLYSCLVDAATLGRKQARAAGQLSPANLMARGKLGRHSFHPRDIASRSHSAVRIMGESYAGTDGVAWGELRSPTRLHVACGAPMG